MHRTSVAINDPNPMDVWLFTQKIPNKECKQIILYTLSECLSNGW